MADISANLAGERLVLSAALGRPTAGTPLQVNPVPAVRGIARAAEFAARLGPEAAYQWWETGTISAAAKASAGLS